MTIRIDRRDTEKCVVVELSGRLSEEVLGEFEDLCGSVPGPLLLDLSNLLGADRAALRSLRRRLAAGAQMKGASPYIQLLLESGD